MWITALVTPPPSEPLYASIGQDKWSTWDYHYDASFRDEVLNVPYAKRKRVDIQLTYHITAILMFGEYSEERPFSHL